MGIARHDAQENEYVEVELVDVLNEPESHVLIEPDEQVWQPNATVTKWLLVAYQVFLFTVGAVIGGWLF